MTAQAHQNNRYRSVAQAYWRLGRFDRPVGTWLLLWPTLWALWLAAQGVPDLLRLAVFVLGTFLMRAAGCVLNDLADRRFDVHVKRTSERVLATGAVSVIGAGLYACALLAASASLLFFLNELALQADTMLQRLGAVVWVEEEHRLDAVTALSGSGPAYVFYFLEAFAAAGESLGLPKKDSETLALQTLKGAIALLEQTQEPPAVLRTKVTSKGGTTAAALAVLEKNPGLMGLMHSALTAAHQRAQEMAKDYAA